MQEWGQLPAITDTEKHNKHPLHLSTHVPVVPCALGQHIKGTYVVYTPAALRGAATD